MRKLRQAVTLIKEWALETQHRGAGERMLTTIDNELYQAGLDDEASVVISELNELRTTPYVTDPSRGLEGAVQGTEELLKGE